MVFRKGESGNLGGRPKGARSKVSLLVERLLEGDVENIVNAVIEAARKGDMAAAKICLDRLSPLRKGRLLEFALPPINKVSDISAALSSISQQMADGELTPDEAGTVAAVLETHRRSFETMQLDERVRKLEAKENDKLVTHKN